MVAQRLVLELLALRPKALIPVRTYINLVSPSLFANPAARALANQLTSACLVCLGGQHLGNMAESLRKTIFEKVSKSAASQDVQKDKDMVQHALRVLLALEKCGIQGTVPCPRRRLSLCYGVLLHVAEHR